MLNINNRRIIFMGTSYFSVLSIEKLLYSNYNVIGVVTITDRFSGRNKNFFVESAVKKYSKLHALPILQSDDLKFYHFLKTLQKWHTEIIIIVAFRILPKVVWELPIFGSFNLHPSLLPNYRGSAPIQWVIINGEIETGVTTFKIDEKVDMGRMILQKKISIEKEENSGSLSIRLSELGAYLVVDTIKCIIYNCITPKKQTINFKMAPKLLKLNSEINWKWSINDLYNKIRGLSPLPGAWCILSNNIFKIYRATYKVEHHYQCNKKNTVKEGYLFILEYQFEGKPPILGKILIDNIRRDSLLG